LDDTLSSLKKQQQQIFDTFNDQLAVLRQPEGLRSAASSIMQLTKTLKEYVEAGGESSKATEYWNLSLKDIEAQIKKGITDAEKEAIDRAIELNDLLVQRADIIKNYNEEERKLTTQGSIERQLPNILKVGKELQALRDKRDKELTDLDKQIKVTTARVDAEKTIFDLTGSIADLRAKSTQMEIEANNTIIEQLRQQMELLKGGLASYVGMFVPTNLQGITGANFSNAPATVNNKIEIGTITVSAATNNPQAFGSQFATSLINELDERLQRRALY